MVDEEKLENDIYDQYKTILDLEKNLMEFLDIYKKKPSEELYYVIGKIYTNCINQNDCLFRIVTNCFRMEIQEFWRNKIQERYANLAAIGNEIRMFRKPTETEQEVRRRYN